MLAPLASSVPSIVLLIGWLIGARSSSRARLSVLAAAARPWRPSVVRWRFSACGQPTEKRHGRKIDPLLTRRGFSGYNRSCKSVVDLVELTGIEPVTLRMPFTWALGRAKAGL